MIAKVHHMKNIWVLEKKWWYISYLQQNVMSYKHYGKAHINLTHIKWKSGMWIVSKLQLHLHKKGMCIDKRPGTWQHEKFDLLEYIGLWLFAFIEILMFKCPLIQPLCGTYIILILLLGCWFPCSVPELHAGWDISCLMGIFLMLGRVSAT